MSTNQKQLSRDKELEIVSMIARGDRYEDIHQETGVAIATVGRVKQRNLTALKKIEQKLAEHKARKTARLLDKTNDLIESKLDKAKTNVDAGEELWQRYQNSEITLREYIDAVKTFEKLTLTELTSVSKEMFSQNKAEEAKSGSGGAETSKAETQLALNAILEAMEQGDAVTLQQIIFAPKEQ